MELTVAEISRMISTLKNPVTVATTHKRLNRAGYKASGYRGVIALYDLSEEDIQKLKEDSAVRGKPKADRKADRKADSKPEPEGKTAAKTKAKKADKKK